MHTPPQFVPGRRYTAALPDDAWVFAYSGVRFLWCGGDDAPAIPTLAELSRAGVAGDWHYMGALDGRPCIAMTLADGGDTPPGFTQGGLRTLFFRIPDTMLALAGRASQIVEWDRTHRYCGHCATPTHDRVDEYAKECPQCGLIAWPRVSPAMMALVTRGREMLLARSRRFANTSMYSALAGFVEAGETVEDCVVREVREEVGLEVAGLRYFGSQSWPFPHSLMIAFTAEYAGGDIRLDDDEIVEARWFSVDALPQMPPSVSIARKLIDATAARLAAT
ncbi:MAG: NAD(+) diphosphatase [Betaproteobacteria bacterium]